MYQLKGTDDTIVAISTSVGQGGIGIVRLSGDNALAITDKIFLAKNKKKPSECKSFTVHYGWIKDKQGEVIDEALLTVMRAPKSYTKQDVVELSSHGGTVVLRNVLSLACELGARLAEPGEFTKRAFLSGRIDLTQAEAVLDIIQAKTDAFLKVSTNQLKGQLTQELEGIREKLLSVYTEIEAVVNFPEDDIDPKTVEGLLQKLESARERVKKLLESSGRGRILKEGIKIVICGRPNVGKSSLLNVLLRTPRAIVSAIAGTTRDTIEETAQINGIPFQLVDTAGILEPRDFVEEEAVKRSRLLMKQADIILFVVDGSQALSQEDESILELIKGQEMLVVVNKADLKQKFSEETIRKIFPHVRLVKISALQNTAIDELELVIVEKIWHAKDVDAGGVLISNLRHVEALKACQEVLENALAELKGKLSLEFVSEEIKLAVNHLDGITGRNIDEDLLDTIFSQFCIGK